MKTPAWQRKEGQSESGGLNKKGRASAKAQGMNLKPPVSKKQAEKSPKSAARRKSYCARSAGQAKMHSVDCSKTPEKRICKARRKWEC
jgi:hypothetical protein